MTGKNKGFLINIIIIIVAVLVLNYIGFNFHDFLNSPEAKERFNQIWNMIKFIWNDYIFTPLYNFWNTIVVGIIWETIKNILDKFN